MTDNACLNLYVNAAVNVFQKVVIKEKSKRDILTGIQLSLQDFISLGQELERAISDIHRLCTIPSPTFRVIPSWSDFEGQFLASGWVLEVNYEGVLFGEKYEKKSFEFKFIELVKTLYHEARHTEQWWLLICWVWQTVAHLPKDATILSATSNFKDHHAFNRLKEVLTTCCPHIKSLAYEGIKKQVLQQILQPSSEPSFFNPSNSLRDKIVTWYYQKIMTSLDSKIEVDQVCNTKKAKAKEYIRYTDDALEVDAFSIENIVAKQFISTLIQRGGPDLANEMERTILTSLTKNAASSLPNLQGEPKPLGLVSVREFQTQINTTYNSLLSFYPEQSRSLSVTSAQEFLEKMALMNKCI